MPHVPDEIWLYLATFCVPRDLWRSLRPVNRQLRDCVDDHFETHLLPDMKLTLPFSMPSYDVREQRRGRASFTFVTCERATARAIFRLHSCDYEDHFMHRWASMRSSRHGHLSEALVWEVDLSLTAMGSVNLRNPEVDDRGSDIARGVATFSFEWKPAMCSLFKD